MELRQLQFYKSSSLIAIIVISFLSAKLIHLSGALLVLFLVQMLEQLQHGLFQFWYENWYCSFFARITYDYFLELILDFTKKNSRNRKYFFRFRICLFRYWIYERWIWRFKTRNRFSSIFNWWILWNYYLCFLVGQLQLLLFNQVVQQWLNN